MKAKSFAVVMLCAIIPLALFHFGQRSAPEPSSVEQSAALPTTKLPTTREPTPLRAAAEAAQQGNRHARRARARFENEGWKIVSAREPDVEILDLRLSALDKREQEIQLQLQSNTYTGEMLKRVRDIALAASGAETRYLAIESLGRSNDPLARDMLIDCYERLRSRQDKSTVLSVMRPRTIEDSTTAFLIGQLDSSETDAALKQQAAAALVGLALSRGSSGVPRNILDRVAPEWQARLEAMYLAARQTAPGHAH